MDVQEACAGHGIGSGFRHAVVVSHQQSLAVRILLQLHQGHLGTTTSGRDYGKWLHRVSIGQVRFANSPAPEVS